MSHSRRLQKQALVGLAAAIALCVSAGIAAADPRGPRLPGPPLPPNVTLPAPPPPGAVDTSGWTLLGEVDASGRMNRAVIMVGAQQGSFTKLMLVVGNAPLQLKQLKVQFGNNQKMVIGSDAVFDQNTRSAAIDLPGEARFIKTIEVAYKNLARGAQAHLQIFARGAAPPAPPPEPAPMPITDAPVHAGWEVLGMATATADQLRTDVVRIGRKDGKFRRLMLDVQGADTVLSDVLVRFGNGETVSPAKGAIYQFQGGIHAVELELPGELRVIQGVSLHYDRIEGGGKTARIYVYGFTEGAPTTGPGAIKPDRGWNLLTAAVIEGRRDSQTLAVGKQAGKYRQIMLMVDGSDAVLDQLIVEFGNGEKFSPTTKLVFREGSRTGAIDLPGDARFIKTITFHAGNLPGTGNARILVLAK